MSVFVGVVEVDVGEACLVVAPIDNSGDGKVLVAVIVEVRRLDDGLAKEEVRLERLYGKA